MVVLRIWLVYRFDLRKSCFLFLAFKIGSWAEYDALIIDLHIEIFNAESQ